MATHRPTPIQSSISADLERELREIQTSSHTGPPGDLDDKKKRWLVVGICLHSILSPYLRKYVDSVVTNLYSSLKLSDQIDIQTKTKYLRTYGAANIFLNYEAINNNKATHGYRSVLYDYKVRSTIRNEWAHCNFTVWDDVKYVQSLQLIDNFIYLLNLNAANKKQMIEELDKWRKNGTSFLQGYTISFELVNEIRQKIQILVEYAEVISKTADTEFGKVHEALIDIGETFSQYEKRISTLENQNGKDFIKTDIFTDILGIIEDNHCVLLTGVSGMGKTLTAQNIALQLCHEEGFSIVPCNNVKDIKKRYKDNVRQGFFVDDICGKYIANIKNIENWMRIKEFVNFILCKGQTKMLATCRTKIVKQETLKKH
ncbi:unnamed protein product [Mytilus coruscus]|uniref:Novel STAND NTPase 3 domain-containing protein n=1 Tax=Mytilus coruscus TaxID=42192 RepID=A0A6J8DQ07_MYTCO|nr:unnamed protein product [Mytilus coruscus]